ncbi:hypothetical protein HDV57DRAFT_333636 [Trichoderma longibrachiatum]
MAASDWSPLRHRERHAAPSEAVSTACSSFRGAVAGAHDKKSDCGQVLLTNVPQHRLRRRLLLLLLSTSLSANSLILCFFRPHPRYPLSLLLVLASCFLCLWRCR